MIHEITNFIENLNDDYLTSEKLRDEGLFAVFKLAADGNPIEASYLSRIFRLKEEGDTDYRISNQLVLREYYTACIKANKYLDMGSGGKKIHSSSGYAIWFKKENIDLVQNRLEKYFRSVIAINDNNEFQVIEIINKIQIFCEEKLIQKIKTDELTEKLNDNDYIKIFFDLPIEYYINGYNNYLETNLFNKEDQGKEYGTNIFLAGAPDKKKFIVPQTTFITSFFKVTKSEAASLEKFRRLLTSKPEKKLPNPLPIFIEHEELNDEVVRLFNKERVLKFREIIRQLFERHNNDISNYYLINWRNTKDGLVLNDFDFVSLFKFRLEGFKIENIMNITNKNSIEIENIFHFESEVVQVLFNRQLVSAKEDKLTLKYFDDIKYDPKYMSQLTYQNVMKYRKAFYDYIYKSKEDAISGFMFYNIIIKSIIDEIKLDKDHKNEYSIKEKLNILFSLNKNYDKQNKNFGGKDMASKIPEFLNSMRKLLNEPEYHLGSDDYEFAFAAGQLIYYILTKSQTSSKTHSLLEPYISKNEPELFKLMITRGIEQYKHAFDFGSRRFEKLASEVLGYDSTMKIKELQPIILAGYFSQSMIYEKSNN